jgi:hypothetical protein
MGGCVEYGCVWNRRYGQSWTRAQGRGVAGIGKVPHRR